MQIVTGDKLREKFPRFTAAWAVYRGMSVSERDNDLSQWFDAMIAGLATRLKSDDVKNDSNVNLARECFAAVGCDPSRYRPSQEAMLRRILKDGKLYHVNSAVDVNNYFSVLHRVSMGIYDADRVSGDCEITVGAAGETFAALNGRDVDLADKIVIRDGDGPFGSPFVDSKRTCITPESKNFLHVLFLCGATLEPAQLAEIAKAMQKYNGKGDRIVAYNVIAA